MVLKNVWERLTTSPWEGEMRGWKCIFINTVQAVLSYASTVVEILI